MREYYVRKEGDEEASGPFTLDQITSLFEAGKLDKEAYVYDIDQEQWIPIEENEELMEVLYPQKQKLSLRVEPEETEEEAKAREKAKKKKPKDAEEEKKSISVPEMLAQAEGRDDSGGRSPIEKRARSAFIGLRFTTLFVLGAAVSMIFLDWDLVKTANALQMIESPYIIFAVVDLVLGVVLLLQVTEIFPLVRLRAAIGLGTLTLLFLTSGDPLLALANAVLCVSVYFCTATLSTPKVLPFCVAGTLGLAGYITLVILPIFS
ncbi:MAG TPA: hypothetical protein DIV79_04435 [Opitutae bacterium]|nr:hypothetical protein [Opitutaceae bacterium]HCR29247.1 hypothetical protein [Opitutae bacterium]